ncbi:hypothetical protein EVG20_g7837 [Dentipellis fragilis]|uniref:Uncharacterized protein n=1 Tax=Dentipellis fragilis TaxID=205917 RepID=A0A4Y9YEK6_9AGAM|nr:hypothetical protein EVG20_g7837 [Dentipellis fragilis]
MEARAELCMARLYKGAARCGPTWDHRAGRGLLEMFSGGGWRAHAGETEVQASIASRGTGAACARSASARARACRCRVELVCWVRAWAVVQAPCGYKVLTGRVNSISSLSPDPPLASSTISLLSSLRSITSAHHSPFAICSRETIARAMEGLLNLHPREWFATQDDHLSAMLTSPQYEFHSGGGVANPRYVRTFLLFVPYSMWLTVPSRGSPLTTPTPIAPTSTTPSPTPTPPTWLKLNMDSMGST